MNLKNYLTKILAGIVFACVFMANTIVYCAPPDETSVPSTAPASNTAANVTTPASNPAASITTPAVRPVIGLNPANVRESYTLQPFPVETVMRNPNSEELSYVVINPGSQIVGNAVLDLWYSYSPITIPDLSTMTISVNGVPVTSKKLVPDQMARSSWQVQLPAYYFRPGANEISVSVIHRTIDGLCRDIDNAANWFTIRPETRISFNLDRGGYTLVDFPKPFLFDSMSAKINTVVYVPSDFDKATLDALMNLATGLGRRGITPLPTRLEVRVGEPGQVDANEIVFGSHEKWHPGKNHPENSPLLTFEQLSNGFTRLLITGNSQSFAKAVEALTRPQLAATLLSNQILLNSPLPTEPPSPANAFRDKKELFTLADLGYATDIPVAGAFHQDMNLTIPRPSNYRISDGSYIELKFRHSKILDPKKSAVTVYINGVPIKGVALMPENADNGVLRVPLPASELNAPSWQVRFGFYHDIGIIDCSKRYDEVAWSVIENETTIVLKPGIAEYTPVWENFPNDFYTETDGRVDLTFLMPQQPTAEELTAAFKLAYYIGVNNQGRIAWDVQSSDTFDPANARGTIIAMGQNNDTAHWAKLQAYLPVALTGENTYQVANWVETIPDVVPGYDICQIGKISDTKRIYAFMYKDAARMNQLLNLTIQRGNPLSGQVALVDAQGNAKTFAPPVTVKSEGLAWFDAILQNLGGTTGVYIIALLAVVAATGAIMFITRKK